MTQSIWIALTVLLGCTQALQVALLGSMNRLRGPAEAAWVSILGTLTGLSLIVAAQALVGRPPILPAPLAHPAVPAALSLLAAALLSVAVSDIPRWLAITGLLAAPYLLAASWLSPRLGVGLFLAAIIAGQLLGGVTLDHFGAFGAMPRPVDPARMVGVAALVIGVVLIRGGR